MSAINPSICASMTFHLCACESACFQEVTEYLHQLDRDYRDDQIGSAKCVFFLFVLFFVCLFVSRIKTSKRQIRTGDQILLPTSVLMTFCALILVVLTACLCSFCHTKATSSASAHNCLIPHDAKLELFALLQMNMGILRRVQIAILI